MRRFLPAAELFLVLADEPNGLVRYPDDCTVIPARATGIHDFAEFAFRYDAEELSAALKPFAIMHLLETARFDRVIHLDAGAELFGPLSTVEAAFERGASFVLAPQLLGPAERPDQPDDVRIMRSGTFNSGVFGVRSSRDTFEAVAWWSRWLRRDCVDAPDLGLFVDQKFLDLLPGLASGVAVLRDPTIAVSVANWRQRDFLPDGPAGPSVGGAPLTLFDFRQLASTDADARGPLASPYGAGTLMLAPEASGSAVPPALDGFVRSYETRVHAAGSVPRATYAYGRFASGTPIPAIARQCVRDDRPFFAGDPFEEAEAWLHLPALEADVGIGQALPGTLARWLQARTPSVAHLSSFRKDEAAAITRWWLALPLDARLLAPAARAAGRRPVPPGTLLPPPDPARPDISLIAPSFATDDAASVVFRSLRGTLSGQGFRLETVALATDRRATGRIAILCVGPGDVSAAVERSGHADAAGSVYRIWVPASEDACDGEPPALDAVDEIWAPTASVLLRFALGVAGPVLDMPPGLVSPRPRLVARLASRLPAEPYIVAVGDGLPGDGGLPEAIEAYRLAGEALPGLPPLVVMPGPDTDRGAGPVRRAAAEALRGTVVLDGAIGGADRLAVISHAAALVSGQRGDALGLAIGGALALGVPVVAGAGGAAAEALTGATGCPAATVGPDTTGATARLDPRHAAWQLREILLDPARARRIAADRRRSLLLRHDPEAAARRQAERLRALDLPGRHVV